MKIDILKFIPVRFYEGEGSGAAPAPEAPAAPAPEAPDLSELAGNMGIPEEDLAVIAKRSPEILPPKPEKKKEEKPKEPEDDLTEEKPATDDEPPAEETPADAEVEDSGKPDGDSDSEWEDNVVDGLKGKDFGALSKDGQAALIALREKVAVLNEAKAKIDALNDDPIIRNRLEDRAAGRDVESGLGVRALTAGERQAIIDLAVSKIGLDKGEGEQLAQLFGSAIDKAAQQMASDYASQKLVAASKEQKARETTAKYRSKMLELGKMNPLFKLEEKDLGKFLVEKERHPEWKKYQESFGKAFAILKSEGFSGVWVANASPERIWAVVGTAMGLPVALNTGKRDQTMLRDAIEKKLAPFKKGNRTGTMSPESSSQEYSGSGTPKEYMVEGVDIVRLAIDGKYYESQLKKKFGDPDWKEWKEKLDGLAKRGREVKSKKK